jgi:hypothetical protein
MRKEPAVASVSHLGPTHLGLDVHKDTISVAILAPDRDGPDVERIAHDVHVGVHAALAAVECHRRRRSYGFRGSAGQRPSKA